MIDLVKQFVRGKRIDALAAKVMLNDPKNHVEHLIREHIKDLERQLSQSEEDGEAVLETRIPDTDDEIIDGYKDYRRLIQRERRLVTLLDRLMSMEMKEHPIWEEVREILSGAPADHAAGTAKKL
jgi:uncharacterized protein (DUF2235 family)